MSPHLPALAAHLGEQYGVWHEFGLSGLDFWVSAKQRDMERTGSLEGNGNPDRPWDSSSRYRRFGQRVRP